MHALFDRECRERMENHYHTNNKSFHILLPLKLSTPRAKYSITSPPRKRATSYKQEAHVVNSHFPAASQLKTLAGTKRRPSPSEYRQREKKSKDTFSAGRAHGTAFALAACPRHERLKQATYTSLPTVGATSDEAPDITERVDHLSSRIELTRSYHHHVLWSAQLPSLTKRPELNRTPWPPQSKTSNPPR